MPPSPQFSLWRLAPGGSRFFSPDGKEGPEPLFFLRAEASTGTDPAGFSLTVGQLNALRQVRFETDRELPKGPQSGTLIKLAHGQFTVDEAIALARRLGMKNPQFGKDPRVGPAGQDEAHLCGENGHLWVWFRQGSWIYSRMGQPPLSGMREYNQEDIKNVALDWLTEKEENKYGARKSFPTYVKAKAKIDVDTNTIRPVYPFFQIQTWRIL